MQNMTFFIIFGVILLVVFAIYSATNSKDGVAKKRVRALQARQDELYGLSQKKQTAEQKSLVSQENFYTKSWVKGIIGKTSLGSEEKASAYRSKLSQAGLRDSNAIWRVFFYKLVLFVVFPIIAAVILFSFDLVKSPKAEVAIIVLSALIGYIFPNLIISHVAEKRMINIKKYFPDAIDMMVVCSDAGLSFDAALKRVSREMYQGSPDMAEELALTSVELNFFEKRIHAFENLAQRIDLPQVRSFVNMLIQTEKFGTPVTQSLRVLSDDFRKERMNTAEVKASKLSTKLTLPMMVFIFLPLFVVILFPAYLQSMHSGAHL